MPIRVVCPDCSAKLNAPDATAGKRLKCPKCQASLLVPSVGDEGDVEVIDEPVAPPQAKSKTGKSVAARPSGDRDEDEPPKKKKSKKKKKDKPKANPTAKLIGTGLALVFAIGAIVFAVVRHTSRQSEIAAAKTEPVKDVAPTTPTGPAVPPPPPKQVPPGPKPGVPTKPPSTPEWDVWNAPKGRFGMRIPPGSKVEAEDVEHAVDPAIYGADRVTKLLYGSFQHTGRGFVIKVHVLQLKAGLSERDREAVMLAQAKSYRTARSLFKVLGEFDTTLAGQKARGESFEGQGETGFRRYCYTDSAVYYIEVYGFTDLSKHWLPDVTKSVESFQSSPIIPMTTPSQTSNPFASGRIRSLAFPAEGNLIAALGDISLEPNGGLGAAEGHVRVWDRTGSKPFREMPYPDLSIGEGRLAFSPDGKVLAALSSSEVVFFDVAAGRVKSVGKLPEENRTIPAGMSFTSDSRAVVVIADKSLVTIQADDGRSLVKKPTDWPTDKAVFVPALNRVVVVRKVQDSQDSEVATWDPATDAAPKIVKLVGIKGYPTAFAVSADGKTFAVCPDNGDNKSQVTLHDAATGKVIGQLPVDDAANFRSYRSLVLSPDGQLLAGIGGGDGVRVLYDSVDLFRVSDGKRIYHTTSGATPRPDELFANALTFTPDSKALYFVQKQKTIISVDTQTGNPR